MGLQSMFRVRRGLWAAGECAAGANDHAKRASTREESARGTERAVSLWAMSWVAWGSQVGREVLTLPTLERATRPPAQIGLCVCFAILRKAYCVPYGRMAFTVAVVAHWTV